MILRRIMLIVEGIETYLYEHVPGWYWSPIPKVTPNTFITNSKRLLYIGGPGTKAHYKFDGIDSGVRVTVDMEEIDHEQGYYRIFDWTDLPINAPTDLIAFLQEKYPRAPEEWQVWIDWSGVNVWTDEPEEPEPIEPEPEPEPVPDPELPKVIFEFDLFGKHYVLTSQRLL